MIRASSFLVTAAMFIVLAYSHANAEDSPRRVYSHVPGDTWARSGMISFDLLLEKLSDADVVFLGEHHGDPRSHEMQNEILVALAGTGRDVALAMEHFERDVQAVVDSYLAGEIDEEEFLANSRPWPNYDPDYKRLIEFCKKERLSVTAGNIPRPLASRVAQEGFEAAWAGYTDEERRWIAASTTHGKDLYWDIFSGMMGGGGHGMGMPEDTIAMYFAAQCIKDDTMAESIARLREADPARRVVHVNGSFHSDYRLGTVSRLIERRPQDKVVTVALRPVDSWCDAMPDVETTPGQDGGPVPVADYIIYVHSPDYGKLVIPVKSTVEEPEETMPMGMG